MNKENMDIASMIDHTILSPKTTPDQIQMACKEAIEYGFKSVCVSSSNIKLASLYLRDSSVLPICVVGFPLGSSNTESKTAETKKAIEEGAKEIDMVINIGALKSLDYQAVCHDIWRVVSEASEVPVKVILETSLLTEREKIIACAISKAAGAHFVKTSTGFSTGGATVPDVKLMRSIVGTNIGVKASGGIRTYEDAKMMIEAGANRIGASASVAIVTKKNETSESVY